ncbi:hypothetical protein DMENIID0001_127710 [Sergentomyia squamirostris]
MAIKICLSRLERANTMTICSVMRKDSKLCLEDTVYMIHTRLEHGEKEPQKLNLRLIIKMQQPPLSSSGATSLSHRRPNATLSPAPSDDSDSDISLGTHSPVPSSMSMQHSPGSASGGGNDRDERLQGDHEKDSRFSVSIIQSLCFDSPATMAGAFTSRFLPTLPYRLGENSPPIGSHSPPIGMPPHHLPLQPTVLRPQPQLPGLHHPPPHQLNGSPAPVSPVRIRVSSPRRINATELGAAVSLEHSFTAAGADAGIIRIAPPTGPPLLHRPFSPSPQPKDVS